MRKGMAMEGFILPDGSVKPSYKYDDTDVKAAIQTNKDNIDNLGSRVAELEKHGGVEDPTKADKVSSATAGNLASLDENGNLQDSDKKPADFALAAHTHAIADVTGLQDALGAKEDTIGVVSIKKENDAFDIDERFPFLVTNFNNLVSSLLTGGSELVSGGERLVRVRVATSNLLVNPKAHSFAGVISASKPHSSTAVTVHIYVGNCKFIRTGTLEDDTYSWNSGLTVEVTDILPTSTPE